MTLGGLALAVGILVDDATVTIENIERHIHLGSDLHKAILDGAGEIAVPALVSTLCICIVFVPMFFLTGVARYLFAPLAEAVVFAMLASYVLSRTLVPTLVMLLMDHTPPHADAPVSLLQRVYRSFDARFERIRAGYKDILAAVLQRRRAFAGGFLAFCVLSCGLVFLLGRDFFPSVDAGQIRLHMRMPSGTRIEETARAADQIEAVIRTLIPAGELGTVLDNLGVPVSSINNTYSNAGAFGTLDGEIQISLNEGHAPESALYRSNAARSCLSAFPGVEFFFQPADMVTQILNFGLPAAIDVMFTGADVRTNYGFAAKIMKQIKQIPGTVDTHIHQRLDLPTLALKMDRSQLQSLGLSANDVAQNLLATTAGTTQTSPGFWLDPVNGVVYNLAAQSPQYQIDSVDALLRTPVRTAAGGAPQLLSNLVTVAPAAQLAVVSRYNLTPAVDVYVSVQGRDLGSVGAKINALVDDMRSQLPRGSAVTVQRAGADHARFFHRAGRRPRDGDRHGVFIDRGEFPVLDRCTHHHHRLAGGAGGDLLDAVSHRDDFERAGIHRRHHDHGRCHRQQHFDRVVRAATHERRPGPGQRGARCGCDPHQTGADDRPGDDHRYDSHGPGLG